MTHNIFAVGIPVLPFLSYIYFPPSHNAVLIPSSLSSVLCSCNFIILRMSYKWNPLVSNLLASAFFTQHYSLHIYPRCCVYPQYIPFYYQFLGVPVPQSLYNHSPIERRLGGFQFRSITNKTTLNI